MNLLTVEAVASALKVHKEPIKLSDRITRWLESDLEDRVLRHKQGEVQ